MEIFDSLIKKIETIPVNDFLRKIISENKTIIEDKNAEQMNRGEMPDGSEITPPYKAITVAIKKFKGQPFDHVTLKDEGKYHKAIYVDTESDGFYMRNSDAKAEAIEMKYGDPLGLSDQSKQELMEEVFKPHLLDKTRKYLEV